MELTREQRFERLLDLVHDPLQRYVQRRATEHEDVLADVCAVLWRRLDDVPAGEELPWAYGVARGCLANASRSEQRRFRLLRRLAAEPVAPPPEADPVLAEALAGLPAGDREVLRLWAWEQLPPREIAVVLGITPNAASIRLFRATSRLRAAVTRKDAAAAGHQRGDGRREEARP